MEDAQNPDDPPVLLLLLEQETAVREVRGRTVSVKRNTSILEAVLVLTEGHWIGLEDWAALRCANIDFRTSIDELLTVVKNGRNAKKKPLSRPVLALRHSLVLHADWWCTFESVKKGPFPPKHCGLVGCGCLRRKNMPLTDAMHVVLNHAGSKTLYKAAVKGLHEQLDQLSPMVPILTYAPLRAPGFYKDFVEPLCANDPALAHRFAFTAKAIGNEAHFHRLCRLEPSIAQGLAFGDVLLKLSKEVTLEGKTGVGAAKGRAVFGPGPGGLFGGGDPGGGDPDDPFVHEAGGGAPGVPEPEDEPVDDGDDSGEARADFDGLLRRPFPCLPLATPPFLEEEHRDVPRPAVDPWVGDHRPREQRFHALPDQGTEADDPELSASEEPVHVFEGTPHEVRPFGGRLLGPFLLGGAGGPALEQPDGVGPGDCSTSTLATCSRKCSTEFSRG